MYWNRMPLISILKNGHFRCISLMKGSFLLEERNTAENSLFTNPSKPVYSELLGLKKVLMYIGEKNLKSLNVYGHVIRTIPF